MSKNKCFCSWQGHLMSLLQLASLTTWRALTKSLIQIASLTLNKEEHREKKGLFCHLRWDDWVFVWSKIWRIILDLALIVKIGNSLFLF